MKTVERARKSINKKLKDVRGIVPDVVLEDLVLSDSSALIRCDVCEVEKPLNHFYSQEFAVIFDLCRTCSVEQNKDVLLSLLYDL